MGGLRHGRYKAEKPQEPGASVAPSSAGRHREVPSEAAREVLSPSVLSMTVLGPPPLCDSTGPRGGRPRS
eukprot:5271303-Pyramimonas_sp.AAC.1